MRTDGPGPRCKVPHVKWGLRRSVQERDLHLNVGEAQPELVRMGLAHFLEGMQVVGMAVAESPELQARKRRAQAQAGGSSD